MLALEVRSGGVCEAGGSRGMRKGLQQSRIWRKAEPGGRKALEQKVTKDTEKNYVGNKIKQTTTGLQHGKTSLQAYS